MAAGAVATASLGLAACSAGGGESGPTEVEVWSRADGETYIEALAESYNASQDEYKVVTTIIPNSDYQQRLGNGIGAGDGPDVAAIDDVLAPYFMSTGAFQDISEKAEALDYYDDLSPAHLTLSQYEGQTYALPFTSDTSVMFYNKDLFAEAGLDPEDPPATWQEFEDAAIAIGNLGDEYTGYHFSAGCGGCSVFTFAPLVWAAGGDLLASNGEEPNPAATFDDPIVVEAVEMFNRMYQEGGMTTASQIDAGENYGGGFESGQLGIVFSGSFYLSLLNETPPDFEVGVTPIPGKEEGDIASFTGGDVLAVPSNSENAEGAWDFISWATGDDAQTELAEMGYTPVRTDLYESVYDTKGPEFAALSEATLNGQAPYSVQEFALLNDANGPLIGLMQSGIFGDDVDAAIEDAQSAADEIVSEGAR
jgi:multiple sugar transport system substrate-binding protein